ncbi:unnamed protein product [Calicophoron daubneyi]|uniref:Inositol hexakisphosphate and diphosphoinositol-pentakisphosphate kinase n=1 Tax=Calicophoron daubneyi TaxID=300641 RepID=A0AAV2TZQ4_CALDB
MSYVCDVNGFSFVKSSKKYYDDCSHILGVLITRKIAPQLWVPSNLPPGTDVDTPLVPTTCGTIMELRCVIAVIRHGDRTPKQKMKMEVRHERFFNLFTKYAGGWTHELKLKRPTQLQEVLDIVRCILEEMENSPNMDPQLKKNKGKFEQLKYVLEMYGSFSGINRKIQLKYHPHGLPKNIKPGQDVDFSNADAPESQPSLLLIAKWGGELTAAGRQQAETLGRAFRCIYPGGDGHYGKGPGLGLLRLHSTYRHDLKIYASDEGRVQMTAAAFTKGFLALEGELPPILVQMVKSANTNGLLDNDNDCRHYQHLVKHRIKEVMSKDADFTEDDINTLVPTGAKSLVNAMHYVGNPRRACDRLFGHVKRLGAHLLMLATSPKDRNSIRLYQGESWELVLRRWGKLLKDFRSTGNEYDLSKISDIYDNIKYDLQHNPGILLESEAQDFFMCAKSLADIVVPQEYGITKEEKLVIGQRICTPLMRKILSDARYTDVDECTRLHAGYSKGVASPERFVRTRLYFTSESHLHSLLTCLRYGDLADVLTDEQWRRAMAYVSSVSEINYLAQIVIMIYEDPTVEPKTEKRFHVELHFSPGAFALCHDMPEGSGFRPGKLERLNSQISMISSATSIGKCSTDSLPPQSTRCSAHGSGTSSAAPSTTGPNSSGRPEIDRQQNGGGGGGVSPYKPRRPILSNERLSFGPCTTEKSPVPMDTPTQASGSRSSLGNLSAASGNVDQGPVAPEYQTVADKLQHLNYWRESVLNSGACNTGTTTTTTTGSASEVCEDEEPAECAEDVVLETSAFVIQANSGQAAVDSSSTRLTAAIVSDQTDLVLADQTLVGVAKKESSPLESASVGQQVGIGRFIITRSVPDQDTKVSPVHAKSTATLPSDNVFSDEATRASSNMVRSVSHKQQMSHKPRSTLVESHKSGRLTVSCSPERYRSMCQAEIAFPDLGQAAVNKVTFTSQMLQNWRADADPSSIHALPVCLRSNAAALSTPITKWLLDQAELVNGESSGNLSLINSELVRKTSRRRNRSHSRPVISFGCANENAGECLSELPDVTPQPKSDSASVQKLPIDPVHKSGCVCAFTRHYSTGSVFPGLYSVQQTAEFSPSQLIPLASNWRALSSGNLMDGGIISQAVLDDQADQLQQLQQQQQQQSVRSDGTGVSTSVRPRPTGTAMSDAMMAYANIIDQAQDDTALTNQAINALTYPSTQGAYHLDIERLVRAVALGASVPRPFCRSLISTAVIRGSRDDNQASSSVPDIKRLMDDTNLAPPTLTPGSSNEFLVPSAPCVPEVYPLETLHNALTLSQLEAFFARLTTHKFPTPFTSPQHPSTPVSYYYQAGHHPYHDSAGSLLAAFPNTSETIGNDDIAETIPEGYVLEDRHVVLDSSVPAIHPIKVNKPPVSTDYTADITTTTMDSYLLMEDVKTHSASIDGRESGKNS